jgi:hypothetical protein
VRAIAFVGAVMALIYLGLAGLAAWSIAVRGVPTHDTIEAGGEAPLIRLTRARR